MSLFCGLTYTTTKKKTQKQSQLNPNKSNQGTPYGVSNINIKIKTINILRLQNCFLFLKKKTKLTLRAFIRPARSSSLRPTKQNQNKRRTVSNHSAASEVGGRGGEALPAVRSARLKLSLSLLMFLRISGRLKVSERERDKREGERRVIRRRTYKRGFPYILSLSHQNYKPSQLPFFIYFYSFNFTKSCSLFFF